MVIYFIIGAVALTVILLTGFFIGQKTKNNAAGDNLTNNLNQQIATLNEKIKEQDGTIAQLNSQITRLTADCEVQKATAQHLRTQHDALKSQHEQQLAAAKEAAQQTLDVQQRQNEKAHAEEVDRNAKKEKELSEAFQKHITELKTAYERQIGELKNAHDRQLAQVKENADKQIEALRAMNQKQVESQMKLIKEQMQATSEEILKRRQEELGERNKEQVSKIIDPLQQSFKAMQEAFDKSKAQQSEALTRLDETIKVNMQKSRELGETADRLTRALTGEVKVQGNFGELKLKQLLEDLELKEGEQFDTQETLRDKAGKTAKGDDGKGLIPDFILHFPNNRHVVVDSKMSLTDYERYMNAESGSPEKTQFLHGHIESVRAQVRRLARKEYSRYLPEGYNRLNFAIMYVPIEGALNLALLNDTTLWRWAYDQGVLVLGPQTMYMNLRVLEMMWTQVRQLQNQQMMMDAANSVIERVQDFGSRFIDVETSMYDTIKKISKLKITTAESGPSIITAAKNLLKAGARENKKKKSLAEMDNSLFLDSDTTTLLPSAQPQGETNPKQLGEGA
ncbi:MAG: DNA recombination protein RmuC [Bacteroidales bacterium]|nr:DNA recombination protein RmuC [Bacteroidales bacterium]